MELDELKSLINHKLSTDHNGRSANDLAEILTRKTGSITDKIKKSLWMEIIFCIIFILLFGYIGIASKFQSLRIYFSFFGVVSIIFLVFVIYLLKRTQQLTSTPLPVKNNLQTIVNIIEEFMKRYFQFTMALIPICFTFAFILGYTEKEKVDFLDDVSISVFSAKWQIITFMIVYLGLLSVGIYYFTKWYLRKLYGRYTEQLKECILELREN